MDSESYFCNNVTKFDPVRHLCSIITVDKKRCSVVTDRFEPAGTVSYTHLLMHKKEIQKLVGKIAQKGYTIVPVEVYFKGSLVKVQVALAKGKKLYDKRQDIAKKDQKREAERDFKVRNLG